jgi:outer membrane protein assembly factor BamE
MDRFARRLAPLLAAAALAACSGGPRIPGLTPYRIDIQQGNYITQDMVSRLKPGMTKDQVRDILGTPLLTDIFHAQRWDYVYWFEPAYGKPEQRKLTVFFADDKLARVAGDVVPAAPKEEAASSKDEKK